MNPALDKLITFAVPCYNSAAYMDHCIQTLLQGGDDIEIILVDDGSTKDDTPAICDRYAQQYPDIVRAVHQPNGGHGEGVNQGLRRARGLYYKVVDSDDWVDVPCLHKALDTLRQFVARGEALDLLVCNYVYEHAEDNTQKSMDYRSVFPVEKVFTWEQMGRFGPSQYLLMHSVIYRTQLLRDCGLELPKHTFYVDNLFVYQPLPFVKSIYYLDLDLYRYFIGRADQSVNESVMVGRVDQQVRVTKLMIDAHDLRQVKTEHPKLGRYMTNYLSMMMTISSLFLYIDGSPEALGKKAELWEYLRQVDSGLYRKMKYFALSAVATLPGYQGRKLSIKLYRLARRVYKFN
jgi:glycosyltransferase involved in cell wall biosynthesis